MQYHLAMTQYMLGGKGSGKEHLAKACTAALIVSTEEEAQQRLAILTMDPQAPSGDARALDAFFANSRQTRQR